MCSIHNGTVAAVVAGMLVFGAGCQRAARQQPLSPVNDTPLLVDEATQVRDGWDRSPAYYANGASVAGGTGYIWQPGGDVPDAYRRGTDAPLAVLNIVSMPVGLFTNSPFKKQVDRGETVPPSFHANPPIPGARPAGAVAADGAEPIAPPAPAEPMGEPAVLEPAAAPEPPVVQPVDPVDPVMPENGVDPVTPAEPVVPAPATPGEEPADELQ